MSKEYSEIPFIVFLMAITSVLFLVGGLWVGYESHPYEACKRKGVGLDDILECVWLLQNQPALR